MGGFGDTEVFSLSPTKLLVAGEGGLIGTGDAESGREPACDAQLRRSRQLRPHWLGLNARMSEFNAALAPSGLPSWKRSRARAIPGRRKVYGAAALIAGNEIPTGAPGRRPHI